MPSVALSLSGLIVSFLGLILLYYMWYLVLIHIHATDVIWFIYVISIPITAIGHGLSKLLDWENKKQG